MTRMERATAHLALLAAEAPGQAAEPFAEEGVGAGGAGGGLGAVARAGRRRPVPCRLAAAGAGLAGDGAQPRPGDQVAGGGEPGHVQAGLGDDGAGQVQADAGDLREPLRGGQHGGARAGAGRGRDRRSASTPCAAGIASRVAAMLVLDRGDRAVQERDLVQVHPGELAVVVPSNMPSSACSSVLLGPPGPAGPGRPATRGSRSPAARASRMSRADLVLASALTHRRQLDQRAFQQLLQPLPLPGPVADQLGPGAGQVPQRPDLRRRHERGPQQAHLGQPGQPLRVELVGLRPPGQLPGVGRSSPAAPPARLPPARRYQIRQ